MKITRQIVADKITEYLHGKLDITTAPGEGTTINIEFDVTTR